MVGLPSWEVLGPHSGPWGPRPEGQVCKQRASTDHCPVGLPDAQLRSHLPGGACGLGQGGRGPSQLWGRWSSRLPTRPGVAGAGRLPCPDRPGSKGSAPPAPKERDRVPPLMAGSLF